MVIRCRCVVKRLAISSLLLLPLSCLTCLMWSAALDLQLCSSLSYSIMSLPISIQYTNIYFIPSFVLLFFEPIVHYIPIHSPSFLLMLLMMMMMIMINQRMQKTLMKIRIRRIWRKDLTLLMLRIMIMNLMNLSYYGNR